MEIKHDETECVYCSRCVGLARCLLEATIVPIGEPTEKQRKRLRSGDDSGDRRVEIACGATERRITLKGVVPRQRLPSQLVSREYK